MNQTPTILNTLRRVHLARVGVDTTTRAARCITAVVIVVTAVILVDALFALPVAGVILADITILAAILGSVGWIVRLRRRSTFHASRLARVVETHTGCTDSRWINAAQLESGLAPAVSPALAFETIRTALPGASKLDPVHLTDPGKTRGAFRGLLLSLLPIVATVLIVPRVILMPAHRLLMPGSDLPPFTMLRFEIAADPSPALTHNPLTIHAAVTGPFVPTSADAVFYDGDRKNRVPMRPTSPGRFELRFDSASDPTRFYIDTPGGRSHTQSLVLRRSLRLESARITLRYPAYTGWPDGQFDLDHPPSLALEGTQVTLSITASEPIRTASLTGESGTRLALTVERDDPRIASVTITPTKDLRRSLELVATEDGLITKVANAFNLAVVADQPPFVQLLSPELRASSPAGWTIPLRFVAGDDVRLTRVSLHTRVNDGDWSSQELMLPAASQSTATIDTKLDPTTLGTDPGDLIRGYVTLTDNFPDPPHASDSPTFEVQILSHEEYARSARERYGLPEFLADVERYAQQLNELAAMRERAALDPENLDDYAELMGALAEQLDERATRQPIYDLEEALQRMLQDGANQLRSQRARLESALAAGSTPNQHDDLSDLSGTLESLAEQLRAAGSDPQSPPSSDLANRLGMSASGLTEALSELRDRTGVGGLAALQDKPALMGPHFTSSQEPFSLTLERLDPSGRDRNESADALTRGVPLQFRELTERYFKRLADDSR